MKRIEHYYTSIIELFPAPYKGEVYPDKASRTFRRHRTLGNDKTELEILSKNSPCPLLFTKLCINFCSNIFDKIYKLLLLQRYLYVLFVFLFLFVLSFYVLYVLSFLNKVLLTFIYYWLHINLHLSYLIFIALV